VRRVEHVAKAAATPGNFPAADEMVDFLQDRRLMSGLFMYSSFFLRRSPQNETLTAENALRRGRGERRENNIRGQLADVPSGRPVHHRALINSRVF
jgi:hypothetical protein